MVVSIIPLQFKVCVHHTFYNVLHVYSTVKVFMRPHENTMFLATYKGELHISFFLLLIYVHLN